MLYAINTSIIITSYNHSRYLEQCIESAMIQSSSNIEIIAIDDGSTDGSIELLNELSQKNNFLFVAQNNQGISKTLNKAIRQHSRGKYIALLASDDYYHPGKIEEQVAMLEANPRAELCYTQAVEFDSLTGAELRTFPRVIRTGDMLNTVFMHKSYAAGSIMFTRDLFDRLGGFDESLKFEDWDFSIRAAAATQFVAVKKPLYFYRFHQSNTLKKWSRRDVFAEKVKTLAKNYTLIHPLRWIFIVTVHFLYDHILWLKERYR
jgi:alpha-1,3-rhamnosyltransferase